MIIIPSDAGPEIGDMVSKSPLSYHVPEPAPPRPARRPPGFLPIFVLLSGMLGIFLLIVFAMPISVWFSASREDVSPEAAPRHVSQILIDWKIENVGSGGHAEYGAAHARIGREIRSCRGLITRDGFHGDGCNWYKVTVKPDFHDRLRKTLEQQATFGIVSRHDKGVPTQDRDPKWWPSSGPPGSMTFRRQTDDITLSGSAPKVWIRRRRT